MKVLFSRRKNDFEHVYDLSSPPRIGEHVSLMVNPVHVDIQHFVVTDVHWTPDHTKYDVSVTLEELT